MTESKMQEWGWSENLASIQIDTFLFFFSSVMLGHLNFRALGLLAQGTNQSCEARGQEEPANLDEAGVKPVLKLEPHYN